MKINRFILIFIAVILLFTTNDTLIIKNKLEEIIPKLTETTCNLTVDLKTDSKIYKLKGTHYNAVEAQCDADPLITADNSKIDLIELKRGNLRWVALSRDLLARWNGPFNYGDTIYIKHTDPEFSGIWYVHDSMNARYTDRIDFLLPFGKKIPGTSRKIFVSKAPIKFDYNNLQTLYK